MNGIMMTAVLLHHFRSWTLSISTFRFVPATVYVECMCYVHKARRNLQVIRKFNILDESFEIEDMTL